jgi:cytochrome c biogenesis protein CcdA/thiol-disulfide isomerase/thioredoxin
MRLRFALFGLLVALTVVGHAQGNRAPRKAAVTPILESDGVRPGSSIRVALRVSLEDGYHTQSNKPKDPNLIPTELIPELPPGISVAEIAFPEPTELKQENIPDPLIVFEHEFTIGVKLDVGRDLPVGELKVPASLHYQACNDAMCFFPVTIPTGWTLKIVGADTMVKPLNEDAIGKIAWGRGEKPGEIPIKAAATSTSPASPANAATAREAVAKLDRFDQAGIAVGYLNSADFRQFIKDAEAGVVQKGMFEGRGPLAILLIVFLGGLALNLTPCVLPMIPINLAIIGAGSQAGSRGRGFLLGSVYGAAMALVYGVLGLIVILTAGTFGAINSSPWFNVAIAATFIILALAMFDLLVIDFSSLGSRFRVNEQSRGTLLVAFTMGGIAALLAGACVAPVVVQVVLFSSNLYATGTPAALALPFVLGLGMAIPWPIAGAGIAALPKPGAWMVRIKQVFGVVILATAVYYGYEAYVLFSSRWVNPSEVSASVAEELKQGWQPVLGDGLTRALGEKKPVLIDLWATWCKDCLVMNQTTLKNADVSAALSNYVKIKVQAETPDDSPAKEIMERYNIPGLPTYVILKPKQ